MLLKDCPEEFQIDGVLIKGIDLELAALKCFDIYPNHTLPTIAAAILQITTSMELFDHYVISPVGLWASLIGIEASVRGSGFVIDSMDQSKIAGTPSYVIDCDELLLSINQPVGNSARVQDALQIIAKCGWRVVTAN